jgi:nitrite reductase/ring-hydroxylating ferredoxin subunit/uncharacterized membrane protein
VPDFQRLARSIEDLEGLDPLGEAFSSLVKAATRPDKVKNALSGVWLGHQLHPMLTDLPIGAWVMAAALDFTGGRRGAPAARRLVGLGVLAALPTAGAGASDWSDTYGPDQRLGLVHALGNLTAVWLQSASYLARRRSRRLTGMVLSLMGLGAMTASAYLGGHLAYNRGVGVNHTAFQERVTEWTDIASLVELEPGKPKRASAGGVPVVLVRQDGNIYALSATCVHAGGPLDEGQLVDGCLRCPWHQSTFRLTDGRVVRGPAAVSQPRWEVRVEADRVWARTSPK